MMTSETTHDTASSSKDYEALVCIDKQIPDIVGDALDGKHDLDVERITSEYASDETGDIAPLTHLTSTYRRKETARRSQEGDLKCLRPGSKAQAACG